LTLRELRIDPLSGHRTIVAGERSRRPGGEPRCDAPEPIDPGKDPFAEGHEERTPPELYAVRPGGGPADSPGWTVRVVPNLYPALTPPEPDTSASAPLPAPLDVRGQPELFASQPATGAHEVIINGPQSVLSLAELPL
jgi:UDPglucose--hexose-1-phosphate uridylyltransferase